MVKPSFSPVVEASRGTRVARSSVAVVLIGVAIAIALATAVASRGPTVPDTTVDAARPALVHPDVDSMAKASLGRAKQLGVDARTPRTGGTQPVLRGKQLGVDGAVGGAGESTFVRSKQLGVDVGTSDPG